MAQSSMSELDIAKRRLVQAYEEGVDPDLASVLKNFPNHREELLDFWVILRASDREEDAGDGSEAGPLSESESATIRDICLSSSLGSEWLEKPPSESDRLLAEVGIAMQRVRESSVPYEGPANKNFQRAAIYSWLAERWAGSRDGKTSRMAVQKLAYLLDKGLETGLFSEHRKHKYGPYDPTARYRDAEPIALRNGYLVASGRYEFHIGAEIGKALESAERYLPDPAVAKALVDALRSLGVDQWALETLATVHAIAVKMPSQDVSSEAVLSTLAGDATWKKKVGRPNFTRAKVQMALDQLSLLGLLSQG